MTLTAFSQRLRALAEMMRHALRCARQHQEFLKNLKQVCRLLGYDEDMLGTHSLRRGSVTDQFRCGIPDQVIKTSGRWKSAAFQRYIDQETILSFHLRAIQTLEAARTKN
jgi:hypothetical protein